MMSRPGHRDDRAVVRDAVLLVGLRRRHLEVAVEHQLLVDDVEDGVGAPVEQIGRAAARRGAAAPLVGEDDLGAVVVERGRVPVGEVLVGDRVEADRVHRIGDVEQDAVARAGAGRQADGRHHRDVVALVGHARGLRAGTEVAALLEPGDRAGLLVGEDARTVDDLRLVGRGERHLDDVDAEERGVRILVGRIRPSSRPARRPSAPRSCPSRRRRCWPCPSDRRRACACASRGRSAPRRPACGLLMSLMSKMRTPRKRSALTVSVTPCVPQSTRPRVCSTDMKSRLP